MKLREFWSNYYEGVDGLVYVIDSADKKRLDEAGEVLSMLLSVQNIFTIQLISLYFFNKKYLFQNFIFP
jgi:ADP-ribosylation factor-like protein 3